MQLIEPKAIFRGQNKEISTELWRHIKNISVDKTRLYHVRKLLESEVGADSYESLESSITPLEFAIENIRPSLAQLLLRYGAEVKGSPAKAHRPSPLDKALELFTKKEKRLKKAKTDNETEVGNGLRKLKKIIRLLVLYGAETRENHGPHRQALKLYNEEYITPEKLLLDAARYGIDKRVREALAAGADIECFDVNLNPRKDYTQLLSIWESKETVERLIAAEYRIHKFYCTDYKYTPLICALRCDQAAIVHLVLAYGAHVDSATVEIAELYENESVIETIKEQEECCCLFPCIQGELCSIS